MPAAVSRSRRDDGEHVGDGAARVGRRHQAGRQSGDGWSSTFLSRNRLVSSRAITSAGAGDAGADRGRGDTPQARRCARTRSNPAAASTASQPTKNTARPASPNVITPSRRRAGGRRDHGAPSGSLGVDAFGSLRHDHLRRRLGRAARGSSPRRPRSRARSRRLAVEIDLLIAAGLPAGIRAPGRD